MSFIYNENRVGPKIDPCGTSHLIDCRTEEYSFICTYWVLLVK